MRSGERSGLHDDKPRMGGDKMGPRNSQSAPPEIIAPDTRKEYSVKCSLDSGR